MLQNVFRFVRETGDAARPVELINAPQRPRLKRELPEAIAVQHGSQFWHLACRQCLVVKLLFDLAANLGYVSQLVWIILEVE